MCGGSKIIIIIAQYLLKSFAFIFRFSNVLLYYCKQVLHCLNWFFFVVIIFKRNLQFCVVSETLITRDVKVNFQHSIVNTQTSFLVADKLNYECDIHEKFFCTLPIEKLTTLLTQDIYYEKVFILSNLRCLRKVRIKIV